MRLSYNPNSSPDFTRPIVVQSPRFSMVLIEPPKTRVLQGEVVPPWLQPIELRLENSPSTGMQVSDLWTHRMRKRVVEDFFPNRVKSKVAPIFHAYYTNVSKQKQLRRFKKHGSTPSLNLGSTRSDRSMVEKEKLTLSSYTGRAEPEPEGTRFPPIQGKKQLLKGVIGVTRPSKSFN